MNKKLIIISTVAVIVLLLVALLTYYVVNQPEMDESTTTESDTAQTEETTEITSPPAASFTQETFGNIKTPHYVSSTPANNELLTTGPSQVLINFDFDLANSSTIQVTRNGVSVTTGEKQISANKLVLSVPVNATQTGNYKVEYSACWPDASCHQGSFGFSVQ